ncbi:MAG: CsgG/HfaB family protein, partial [Candidatus Zixiibacteriota bacterium]
MSNCSDKRLGEKLFAWELGLLNEVETEEFEVHLIECDHCRAKAEIFSSSSKLMRHNQKFREVVDEVNADLIAADKLSDANKKPGSGAGRVTRFVSTFAFAAAILIILIVKPWKIEIEPNLEAFAAQNRMAVMYFENLADEKDSAKIGDIATNLLITDLSESKYLSVLSNQWLYDVLKNRGLEGTKRIDKETALDIARETDARWIIFGSILQLEPQIIITTQLINVENGQVVTSQRINGTEMDDIFSVIDKLTRKIKLDISLPEDASEEIDRAVADVTTHSPQAYKKYIEGLEAWNMFLEREAVDLFLESIEYDSTFAMAYYQLSLISTSPSITDYIRKALSQIDRVSKQEKIYINSRAAFLIDQNPRKSIEILKEGVRKYPNEKYMHYYLGVYTFAIGDSDESIRFVKKALEIDPNFRSGLNQLAYSYQANQDYENAIITMNKYIELVPDEPNPYDSRGDIYYRSANLEKAMESYEMALEIKPDFESSLKKLADLKMVIRQFE